MNKQHVERQAGTHLEYLQRLIPELINRSVGIKFDSAERFDLYAVMLYASVIELANGACRLISIGEPTGSRTITRMALEALVDLTNLMNDREYVNNLDVRALREWQKTYELAENGNPFLSALAEEPDLEEQKNAGARELAELRNRGFTQLTVEQRFRLAGMPEVYEGLYRWLCSDSHNSLRGLILRHLEVIDENTANLHILRESPADDQLPEIDTLSSLLISASQLTHIHFGDGADVVADLERELNNVRQGRQQ